MEKIFRQSWTKLDGTPHSPSPPFNFVISFVHSTTVFVVLYDRITTLNGGEEVWYTMYDNVSQLIWDDLLQKYDKLLQICKVSHQFCPRLSEFPPKNICLENH